MSLYTPAKPEIPTSTPAPTPAEKNHELAPEWFTIAFPRDKVIAPEAEAKLYVTATVDERARRRQAELERLGRPAGLEAAKSDIEARDARDRSRAVAPLTIAADAFILDTTSLGVSEAVAAAIEAVESRRTFGS
jgi:cytidylate kinase